LWFPAHNVVPSNITISCMQKHIRSEILYHKIKHVVNGLCWNFNTDAKLDILPKSLGENILIGIQVGLVHLKVYCTMILSMQ
jgi:hypothetical protein